MKKLWLNMVMALFFSPIALLSEITKFDVESILFKPGFVFSEYAKKGINLLVASLNMYSCAVVLQIHYSNNSQKRQNFNFSYSTAEGLYEELKTVEIVELRIQEMEKLIRILNCRILKIGDELHKCVPQAFYKNIHCHLDALVQREIVEQLEKKKDSVTNTAIDLTTDVSIGVALDDVIDTALGVVTLKKELCYYARKIEEIFA